MIWRRSKNVEQPRQTSEPLSGLIDLHAHLLPGCDDGAADVGEVAQILEAAAAAGFLAVAATPHVMAEGPLKGRDDVLRAFAQLKSDPALGRLSALLVPGAEHYMDELFFQMLERGDLLPLGGVGRSHVLVEVPVMGLPPFMAEAAFRMRVKGWTPVLAHPERYVDVVERPERLIELREMGYLLQGNLSSLAGSHGRTARRTLDAALRDGLIDLLASDAHSPRRAAAAYGDGLAHGRELLGDAELKRLLIDAPARLLAE